MHTDLTGTAETSRLSPRNGFTAYTCSPRGTASFAPVAPPAQAGGNRRQGRGARTTRFRRTLRASRPVPKHLTPQRPSQPAPTFRDDAHRPLMAARAGRMDTVKQNYGK